MTRTDRNESEPLLGYSALEFRFHLVGNLASRVAPLFRAMGYSPLSPELGTTARRVSPSTSTELTLEGPLPGDQYELLIDGDSIFRTVDLGALVHQAVWEVTRRGVASSNQPIVLHAGAVVLKKTTVLISGPSGSGKSTLTAALLDRGASYLTDEAVEINEVGCVSGAIGRPIHLSRESLDMLTRVAQIPDVDMPGGGAYLMTSAPDPPIAVRDKTVVIFLEGHADEMSVGRSTGAERIAWLAGQSFLPGARTQAGLEAVKKLASRTPQLTLRGGSAARRAISVINFVE